MVNETILAVIIAFVVSAVLCPIVIPFLHRLKFGQQVRDDGPQSAFEKAGNPDDGRSGNSLPASSLRPCSISGIIRSIIPVLFMTVGFGVVGFLDDYIKIVMKRSEGLNPIQKLIGQFVITGIFAYYIVTSPDSRNRDADSIYRQVFDRTYPVWLFVPALFFIILGTDNGVNFTDGLDGLCTSVTILVATFFTIVAIGENSGISPITGAVVGSLLGFLLFNVYPAQCVYGRYRFTGTWRFCCFQCLYDADADLYRDRGSDLSGGSIICYYSGNLF